MRAQEQRRGRREQAEMAGRADEEGRRSATQRRDGPSAHEQHGDGCSVSALRKKLRSCTDTAGQRVDRANSREDGRDDSTGESERKFWRSGERRGGRSGF